MWEWLTLSLFFVTALSWVGILGVCLRFRDYLATRVGQVLAEEVRLQDQRLSKRLERQSIQPLDEQPTPLVQSSRSATPFTIPPQLDTGEPSMPSQLRAGVSMQSYLDALPPPLSEPKSN